MTHPPDHIKQMTGAPYRPLALGAIEAAYRANVPGVYGAYAVYSKGSYPELHNPDAVFVTLLDAIRYARSLGWGDFGCICNHPEWDDCGVHGLSRREIEIVERFVQTKKRGEK
jgi:hypothetical protein